MKAVRYTFVFGILLGFSLLTPKTTLSQCAMCSLNAENSTQHGNTQGKGLNNGIFFLLGAPFLIGAGIGILWYKKYRVKTPKVAALSRH
ncbi:hypothetical protein M472_17320 [Sphingobacterium paucimobilis HER1398]|uniref:Uncharacterized protein n=1 Tax=Sphingobacterium paucimobilis HER1398 TaxID=1346330 RepID=U2JCV9_9SPHI|nr:hypothetical protein M472_17320 [Sphingobacterium paucimobilis HER1398]